MPYYKTPSGISVETFPYDQFMGIDAVRDFRSLDTGKEQHLVTCNNAFCDWRGQIVKDGGATHTAGTQPVTHLGYVSPEVIAWAEREGGGTSLNSNRDHKLIEIWGKGAVVTSTVFNKRRVFFAKGEFPRAYNGKVWTTISTPADVTPAFGVSIQRRLAVAGIPGKENEIQFSRVDNEFLWPDDESESDENPLRAGFIDISNLLGTADRIKGLGNFETNRLAVFTNDQCLVYIIDPDLSQWTVDDRANIRVGTISHNTIVQAGTDLIFCARDGVYSLRRSKENAVQLFTLPMSQKILYLYRQLVRTTPNQEAISAVWDQDEQQYHIFFPQVGGVYSRRLTMTVAPEDSFKWSTGDFLNSLCAASYSGQLSFGTSGGVYRASLPDETDYEVGPEATIETPILWCGSITNYKNSHQFIMQATGAGSVVVEAFNDEGKPLSSFTMDIENDENEPFPDSALSIQYERKFEHRFRGVQFRFTLSGSGLVRITGFAVIVRKQ